MKKGKEKEEMTLLKTIKKSVELLDKSFDYKNRTKLIESTVEVFKNHLLSSYISLLEAQIEEWEKEVDSTRIDIDAYGERFDEGHLDCLQDQINKNRELIKDVRKLI